MFEKIRAVKKEVHLSYRNILDSFIYWIVRKRSVVKTPRKIVFVCTGNICRSAFAEKLLKEGADDRFQSIESCGLDVEVSSPPPCEAVRAADKIGLDLRNHLSKGIECCDLEGADLILAMEYRQYCKLIKSFPHKLQQIKLLREFAPFPENLLCNIDDPFGNNERAFEKCFAQIQRSVSAIKMRFFDAVRHAVTRKIKIRRMFSALLAASGIHLLLERICLSDRAFVLMYHRIQPSAENQACYVQPGMFVTPVTFEQQVAYVRDNFEVVFLDDLVEKAQRGEYIGRHCALTFDDGWLDNYTDAFPVLERYRVPATIFLSTGFVGTTRTFWPEELCYYLERIDLGTFSGINAPPSWDRFTGMIGRFQCRSREWFLNRSIETLKAFALSDREEILKYLRNMLGAQAIPRQMLNWDEVRKMGLSGLVRFGAHTVNHEILDQVPLRRARVEITDSRNEIERHLGTKVRSFAYPNGNHNAGVRQLLAENGFDVAVTTSKGLLGHALPFLEIPRIGLHEDVSATIPMFRSKILLHAF